MTGSTTLSPLRYRIFLYLLVGSLLSNFGNAIQSVGAAWHLTVTHQPADVIALVQSATNLPIMLLALPAGAWADMFDRRMVMLAAQCIMLLFSVVLALLAFRESAPPAAIIGLTALLACGVAAFNPALSASIGNLVPRTELAAAVALNILAFNVARSLGPAIGGGIVAVGGAKAAFVANALSYLAVIVILWRWRPTDIARPERKPLLAAIAEGFRFARQSVAVRTIMLRAVTFTTTGSAAWALMPLVAADLLGQGSVTFGLLLGALGLGAVIGAASATWFRTRFASEAIIRAAGIIYGLGNIIENATEFAKSKVDVTAKWSNSGLIVTIADDGPGFRAEIMDSIGEPYVTTRPAEMSDGLLDEDSTGLGLGFFIAKTLLERSGATVSLANRSGGETGAVVTVSGPRTFILNQ